MTDRLRRLLETTQLAGGQSLDFCDVEFDGSAPAWVQLLPLGKVTPVDGRGPWRVTDPAGVVAASLDAGRELPIDYEHQTQLSEQNGQPAPAAGWIKELQVRRDGIYGRVEWTEKAKAHIEAREYRFLSPVFIFDTETREVLRIQMAALTNTPALTMTALAKREEGMDELLKQLRALLGLDKDANAEAVCSAVGDLAKTAKAATGTDTALATIAKALGCPDGATAEAVATAATQSKAAADANEPDPAKFVKVEDYNTLAAEVATLKQDGATRRATAAVDGAVQAGKLLPAQREWAMAYAERDLEGFEAFVAKQPQIVKPGGGAPQGDPPASVGGSDEDAAICRNLGISAEALQKTREAEVEREKENAA